MSPGELFDCSVSSDFLYKTVILTQLIQGLIIALNGGMLAKPAMFSDNMSILPFILPYCSLVIK